MSHSSLFRRVPILTTRIRPRLWDKVKDPGRDDSYRNWITFLPCVVCYRNWPLNTEIAKAIVEAAEMNDRPISDCSSRGRCSDRQKIPVCSEHIATGADDSLDRTELIIALHKLYPLGAGR